MTANNASSNNVQVAALYELENSFDAANHVQCFNHTIQLSSKALIKPFNVGMGKADGGVEDSPGDMPSLEEFDHDDDTDDDGDAGFFEDKDEEDDSEGESEMLSEEEHSSLMNDTSAVRETVSKVRLTISVFMFYLILATFLSASTTLICNHSFNYHRPPSMATSLPGP